jgi:uncharacterized protein with PIN domain
MAPSLVKNAGANKLLAKPKPTFIVDSMLGSVARKLRFFGFDTLYENSQPDGEIIQLGIKQKRVILTCDRDMYKRAVKSRADGTLLYGLNDLEDIAQAFFCYGTLLSTFMQRPRCPACNGNILEIPLSQLKSDTHCIYAYNQFFQCSGCGKLYWEGSHYKSLKALSKRIDGCIIEKLRKPGWHFADCAPFPRLDFLFWRIHLA